MQVFLNLEKKNNQILSKTWQKLLVENELIKETDIEIEPSAPPPGYNEIDYDSTPVSKRNFDKISMNSLPAFEDILCLIN